MQITDTMDLDQLAERMGVVAIQADTTAMRDLLVAQYDGQDTRDIPEPQWLALLDQVASPNEGTMEYNEQLGKQCATVLEESLLVDAIANGKSASVCSYCGGDGYHAVPRTPGIDCHEGRRYERRRARTEVDTRLADGSNHAVR